MVFYMRIAICDDHKAITKELSAMIQKFGQKHYVPLEFFYFSKPSKLYEYIEENPIDLIFMDLEFCNPAEDGIEWSKRISKKNPRIIIIVLTAYEKRYKEGFEARVFRFMTKPIQEKELFDNLAVSLEELQLTASVPIVRRGITQNILIQDICYLSAQSGGSELWTRTDMYFCDESLLQWEQRLPDTIFFRCHHKYLVNLTYVTDFANHILTLINGEKIPVSRRRWKEFQIAYMKWDTKHFRL